MGNTKIISQGEGEVEEIAMSHDRNVYYVTNIEDINRRHIWKYNINDQSHNMHYEEMVLNGILLRLPKV